MDKKKQLQPKHGKVTGAVWRKRVKRSIHQMRKPRPAWCVDTSDLERAEQLGANWLELYETESKAHCHVALAQFHEHGRVFDYGHSEQIALSAGFFRGGRVECGKDEAKSDEQMALFG